MPTATISPRPPGLRRGKRRIEALALGTLPEFACFHLRQLQVLINQAFQNAISPHDLTFSQFVILALVRENAGVSQSELGVSAGIDRSSMVAVIDRLEGRGLVARSAAQHDRRCYVLRLTRTGERLVNEVMPRLNANLGNALKPFTDEERRHLLALVIKLGQQAGARREFLPPMTPALGERIPAVA